MVNPYLWLAGLILVICTHGAAYFKGHSNGVDSERKAQQEEVEKWRTNAEAAAELYEEEKQRKKTEYRTITKTVEKVKNAQPSRAECSTSSDWMRLFQQNADVANSIRAAGEAGAGTEPAGK